MSRALKDYKSQVERHEQNSASSLALEAAVCVSYVAFQETGDRALPLDKALALDEPAIPVPRAACRSGRGRRADAVGDRERGSEPIGFAARQLRGLPQRASINLDGRCDLCCFLC